MKMRQNLLFLILISYVFTSCEPKHKEVKSINENFNRYINETFPNVKFKDTAIFYLFQIDIVKPAKLKFPVY